MFRGFAALCALLFLLNACDKLSISRSANCLDPKSDCYLKDTTLPILVSSTPGHNSNVSNLPPIDLNFSEKLKDADNPAKYSVNFGTIKSIYRTSDVSVRVVVATSQQGDFVIADNGLTDYALNPVTFSVTIKIGGGAVFVNGPSLGVYMMSGYNATNQPNASINWYNGIDLEPGTGTGAASEFFFQFKLGDDASDCQDPSIPLMAGSDVSGNIASGAANSRINTINYASFTPGTQNAVVCMRHTNPYTAQIDKIGADPFIIYRKDTLPVTIVSPAAGNQNVATDLTASCNTSPVAGHVDCNTIIYTLATTTDPVASPVATPADPDFDGAFAPAPGTKLNGKLTLLDPGVTRVKLRSLDLVNNKEASPVTVTYTVDSTLPVVQITANQNDAISNNAGAINASNLTWHTNRTTRPYEIRVDGSTCGNALFTPLLTGNTPGVANADVVSNITPGPMGDGANTVRVCVQNLVGAWGEATYVIVLDDDPPSLVVNPASGIYPGTVAYSATCLDGSHSCDKIAYTINSGPTAVAVPANPAFNAAGGITSGTLYSGSFNLSPPAQLFNEIKTIARDKAGNVSTIVSQSLILDATYPTIAITGNTSDYLSNSGGVSSTTLSWTMSDPGNSWNIRYDATTCANGTQIASGATSLAANTTPLNATMFSVGAHTLRICAYNSVGTVQGYGVYGANITRDDTAPTVTNITSSQTNGTYITGQSIILRVTTFESVTVTGTPRILLNAGAGAYANYTSGSGSATLSFTYTISAGEAAADLNYAATNSLALNGGTIKDLAGNSATLTLPATGGAGSLGTNKNFVVDGVSPSVTIASLAPLNGATNQSIATNPTVVFSELMDTSTLTLQSLNGACTGSVQLSANNFASCIGGAISFAGSPTTATINPGVGASDYLGYIKTYKRRVTTAAKDANGNAIAAQYTDATGFSTPSTINISGYQLLDTGLAACYRTTDLGNTWLANAVCTGFTVGSTTYPFGQDPHYNANSFQFYTTDGYETVTDYRAGVIWERCLYGQSGPTCTGTPTAVTYTQAASHCSTLTTAGRSWRLPTVKELAFVADYSQPNPYINTAYFTGTPVNQSLWSSTVDPNNSSNHYRFYYGSGATTLAPDTNTYGVRCVASSTTAYQPVLSPAATGPTQTGTVVDSKTGLEWDLCSLAPSGGHMGWSSSGCLSGIGTHTWIDAVNYCEGLAWNGYTDWRLPNYKELMTIVNHTKTGSSPRAWAPENFWLNGQYTGRYWSASRYNTTSAYYVDFATGNGGVVSTALTTKYAVRCVR